MDKLKKQLYALPKPKLGFIADWKIRARIRLMMFAHRSGSMRVFFMPMYLAKNYVAVTVLAAMTFTSTSFYAYGSPGVVPGDRLYPLKRTVENAEKIISLTDSSKVSTLDKLSERRLDEALAMSVVTLQDGQAVDRDTSDDIKKNIDDAVANYNSSVVTANKMESKDPNDKIKNKVKKNADHHFDVLEKIKKEAVERHKEDVVAKIEEAKEAIGRSARGLYIMHNESATSSSGNADDDIRRSGDTRREDGDEDNEADAVKEPEKDIRDSGEVKGDREILRAENGDSSDQDISSVKSSGGEEDGRESESRPSEENSADNETEDGRRR